MLAPPGWRIVPRELPCPPPRVSPMAPLARRPRPEGCSCFLPSSSSHPRRPLWPAGSLRLGNPGPHICSLYCMDPGTGMWYTVASRQQGMMDGAMILPNPIPHHMFNFSLPYSSANSLYPLLHLLACWAWPLSPDIASWPLWHSPFQPTLPQQFKSRKEELPVWQSHWF